jgi:hypothetical protein
MLTPKTRQQQQQQQLSSLTGVLCVQLFNAWHVSAWHLMGVCDRLPTYGFHVLVSQQRAAGQMLATLSTCLQSQMDVPQQPACTS